MRKILFVCHGNICRSAMAECMFAERVRQLGTADEWEIDSAATSREEIGNPIYPPARRMLENMGIPVLHHRARQITQHDVDRFDVIVYMDRENLRSLQRMFGSLSRKFMPMLPERDVADPWYTGNFSDTYRDIDEGITAILDNVRI